MKKQINDLLLKMQNGENCIGETANKLLNLYNGSGSFSDKDLLNGYCAGALETLINKETTFLGYDHLIKIKTEAEEWKERYSNDR